VIVTSRKTDNISLPSEMNRMVLKKEGQKKNTEEGCDGVLLIVPDCDLKLYKRARSV